MIDLNNKIPLVTGGSQGLGRVMVEGLAAEGASVWTIARDTGRLDRLKREVTGVQTRAGASSASGACSYMRATISAPRPTLGV